MRSTSGRSRKLKQNFYSEATARSLMNVRDFSPVSPISAYWATRLQPHLFYVNIPRTMCVEKAVTGLSLIIISMERIAGRLVRE